MEVTENINDTLTSCQIWKPLKTNTDLVTFSNQRHLHGLVILSIGLTLRRKTREKLGKNSRKNRARRYYQRNIKQHEFLVSQLPSKTLRHAFSEQVCRINILTAIKIKETEKLKYIHNVYRLL